MSHQNENGDRRLFGVITFSKHWRTKTNSDQIDILTLNHPIFTPVIWGLLSFKQTEKSEAIIKLQI